MANTPARQAASNLASWIELLGLPVPDFLNAAGIDEQVTDAVLTFYGLVPALLGSGVLVRAEKNAREGLDPSQRMRIDSAHERAICSQTR